MDFKFEDPEIVEIEGIRAHEIKKHNVYVFSYDTKGIKLKLSSAFAYIIIEKTQYIDFSIYSSDLFEVTSIIKDGITYFNLNRLGLRKINQCIIFKKESINKYFEKQYFNLFESDDNVLKIFEVKDCFLKNNFNVNYRRSAVHGTLGKKDAYQIILDSDIYLLDSDSINLVFNDKEELGKMNEILFEIYKNTVTCDFILKLTKEKFLDNNIIGVEKNEK